MPSHPTYWVAALTTTCLYIKKGKKRKHPKHLTTSSCGCTYKNINSAQLLGEKGVSTCLKGMGWEFLSQKNMGASSCNSVKDTSGVSF